MGEGILNSYTYCRRAPWKFFPGWFPHIFIPLKSRITSFKMVNCLCEHCLADFSNVSFQTETKWNDFPLFLLLLPPPQSMSSFHFHCANSLWILVIISQKKKKSNGAIKGKMPYALGMGMYLVNKIVPYSSKLEGWSLRDLCIRS